MRQPETKAATKWIPVNLPFGSSDPTDNYPPPPDLSEQALDDLGFTEDYLDELYEYLEGCEELIAEIEQEGCALLGLDDTNKMYFAPY